MKAIIKATGEITTVECRWVTTIGGNDVLRFIDQKTGISYAEHQLAFLFQEDNNREPDYWTRLEHQYAGMAMQGILSNPEYLRSLMRTKHNDYRVHEVVPIVAELLSRTLVEKLKNSNIEKEQ